MPKLVWDQTGARLYETGVDHGVLYIPDSGGDYTDGVAWNGLTTVTESPSGAEATAIYADNIKYLNLISAEEFGATIEAYTYPEEFGQFDGTAAPSAGILVGQQARKQFGLSYRTRVGNDLAGSDYGYKLHLIYGATAAPSEKAYATINDSPEAITFSWELTTSPVEVGSGLKPTAQLTIDSTKVDAAKLAALELILYGSEGTEPRLPLPAEVLSLFGAGVTNVNLNLAANKPTFNEGTGIVTLPNVTGIQWKVNGQNKASGAQPPIAAGTSVTVSAVPVSGAYSVSGDNDTGFTRPA